MSSRWTMLVLLLPLTGGDACERAPIETPVAAAPAVYPPKPQGEGGPPLEFSTLLPSAPQIPTMDERPVATAVGQEGAATGFVLQRAVRLKIADLTGRESEIHRLERVKIRGDRVSIDDETFGRRLIIRPDLGLAWVVDLVDRTYSEVTFDAVAKRRTAVVADLRSALARVEGSIDAGPISDTLLRLGELNGLPVSIRSTGKTEKVGGRDAVGREIRLGDGISYINVLVDPGLEGALGYFDALAKLGAFNPDVAGRLKELGGFPVRGDVRYALFFDLVKASEEVTSAARADLADADFERPAGLARVPLASVEPQAWTPPAKPKNFTRSFAEDEIDRERNPFRQDEKK